VSIDDEKDLISWSKDAHFVTQWIDTEEGTQDRDIRLIHGNLWNKIYAIQCAEQPCTHGEIQLSRPFAYLAMGKWISDRYFQSFFSPLATLLSFLNC
jgi:hypothetical protein